MKIFAFSGYGTVGKTTAANALESILNKKGSTVYRCSFAYELRKELARFVEKQLGFSVFTTNPKEKVILRPLLVTWGTDIRRKLDENYWVKKMKLTFNNIKKNNDHDSVVIVDDLRFENEAEWIHNEGGKIIFLNRQNINPINNDENTYTRPLMALDYVTTIDYPNFSPEGIQESVRDFCKQFLTEDFS